MKTKILPAALAALMLLPGTAGAKSFPDTIALPDGWQPEGIATGRGTTFYVGSIPDGAVWRGSYRTGEGAVLVAPRAGRNAIGLKHDGRRDRLFVAGGPSQRIYVYDAATGADVRVYEVPGAEFINDVVITRRGAYFTDSMVQVLYKVPIGRGGRLGELERIPITGDLVYTAGFNANGIDASPDGKRLIIVKTNTGELFEADPHTGATRRIPLDEPVTFGDGILLEGRTLYVVRNQLERVAVVALDPHWRSGEVERHLVDPRLDVPTTIAPFGRALYAVNARFPPSGDNRNPREDVIRLEP